MTAAIATAPFPAIRTDSVWSHDIVFEGEALAAQPMALTLVSVGRPLVARRFDLDDGLSVSGANRLLIRLAVSQVEDLRAADYALQIQRGEGDAAETLLIGSVSVENGLEGYLNPASGPLQTAVSKASGTPVITVPAATTRVVRGGGLEGPPGPNRAELITIDDALVQIGAATVEEALIILARGQGFGGLIFTAPANTTFIGAI
jgi:hypothetical protein